MKKELTNDELFEKGYAIQEKYEKKEIETLKSVLAGKIASIGQLVEELEDLNRDYLSEVEEFRTTPTDLNPCTIQFYKEAAKRGENVVEATYSILRIFGIAAKMTEGTWVFVNEKGQPCDENGFLLAKDLDHRVFEVIKGGKK